MKEIEISPYGSLLVYKQGYSVDFVRSTIQEKQLRGLRIFAQLEDTILSDLNFLHEYSFLEALDITSVDDYDFGFLSSLKGLKDLSISVQGKNEINLTNNSLLERLTIQWRKGKIKGIENCQKLEVLNLIDFHEDDFIVINQLRHLKQLNVKTATIKTTKGLDNFDSLKTILLANCKSLKSIETINGKQDLQQITIESCPQIEDYDSLKNLPTLKELQLIDCKGLQSIKFIKNLSSLEKISLLGNTDILDGDMTPAQNIKEVIYKHRRHYNLKIENKEYDNLVKQNLDKLDRGEYK